MRSIIYTNQFNKDFKHIQKQNKDLAKLKTVITKLAAGEILDNKF
jgi:addiction module RelE/StbE family toxin